MNASAGFSFCFVHVYSIVKPFLSIVFGSMLKVVKSREKMFRFIVV